MNELILIIVFLVILFGSQLLIKRIRKPLLFYIRISSAIALFLFVWLFNRDGDIPAKVILSVLALTSLYKEHLSLKRFQSAATK